MSRYEGCVGRLRGGRRTVHLRERKARKRPVCHGFGCPIAGACSTATHGSGEKNGNLATAVSALEMVTAAGDVVKLSRKSDGEVFRGAMVGLGALGVITRLTLDILPTYEVRQDVYENLPLAQMKDHCDEVQSSVSLFTDWQKQRVNEVWVKILVEDGQAFAPTPEFFGAKLAVRNLHPIAELSAENCTEQMGVPGPWHERLPHSEWASPQAPGKSSNRNTSYLGATASTRFWPWSGCATR
jgi:xylitol oxidase